MGTTRCTESVEPFETGWGKRHFQDTGNSERAKPSYLRKNFSAVLKPRGLKEDSSFPFCFLPTGPAPGSLRLRRRRGKSR